MIEAGTEIKDYLGTFVADYTDLSTGRVALQVSAREVEILGESLVREVIAWALGSKHPPYSACADREADFLADISVHEQGAGAGEEAMLIKLTFDDVFDLGQFFVLGMLKWMRGIQVARRRSFQLRQAILAKRAEMAIEQESGDEEDDEDTGRPFIN